MSASVPGHFQRLQKVMSQRGMASRRQAETYIEAGYVWVNDQPVTQLGCMVDPYYDRIVLRLPPHIQYQAIAFHKPKGMVTHSPQPNETEIKDVLPPSYRALSPVGRLDKASEGLIILTNDGRLSRQLLTGRHEREYIVRVNREFTTGMQDRLLEGVSILGAPTLPIVIHPVGPTAFHITLTEGRHHHIRRLCHKVGLSVVQLKRIRIGGILLGDLVKGHCRDLWPDEFDWVYPTGG
ncbi:rRNA pseudouridine synthase [bacterium]|nr:rRNA pseudouridine synthase [bacterium]